MMTTAAIHATTTEAPWDFQWSGARMLLDGLSPYEVFLRDGADAFVKTQLPNYAPLLYVILAPFGLLSLSVASALWAALNVALGVTAAVLVGQGAGLPRRRVTALTTLLFMSLPFYDAVAKGQQTLLVLIAALLAVRMSGSGAGIAVAVMLTKYSFAPMALLHVAQKRWRVLAVAAAVHVAGVAVFCGATGSSVSDALSGPLQVAEQAAFPGSGSVFTLAQNLDAPQVLGYGAAVVLAVAMAFWARRVLSEDDWVEAFAAASLIALATFPHLLYDYCFLLPVAAIALRPGDWRRRAALLAPVALLWFGWLIDVLHPYHPVSVAAVTALILGAFVALVSGSRTITSTDSDGPVGQHRPAPLRALPRRRGLVP